EMNARRLLNHYLKFRRNFLQSNQLRFNANSCQSPKVLFFGTDYFSLPSLQLLHQNNVEISVVTSFKSPANCVRKYCEKQKLPLYRWPITPQLCTAHELGVVVSFGHMIPVHIINAFSSGIINVHASLLPRWRGAAPIIYAMMSGDSKTGVSIMTIKPHHFDVGDILAQRELEIRKDIFMPELHCTLSHLGAELLLDTVYNVRERIAKATPQDEALATYAPKIKSNITEIVWQKQNAMELYDRYRALYGFKTLTTSFLNKQVQLLEVRQPQQWFDLSTSLIPSHFAFHRARKSLIIGCAQGTMLEITQLRIEGKKPMSAQDFNNGFLKQASLLQFHQNKNAVF
ncbi:hypothetical protein KR093_009755, partial [Drosophila rubida]